MSGARKEGESPGLTRKEEPSVGERKASIGPVVGRGGAIREGRWRHPAVDVGEEAQLGGGRRAGRQEGQAHRVSRSMDIKTQN